MERAKLNEQSTIPYVHLTVSASCVMHIWLLGYVAQKIKMVDRVVVGETSNWLAFNQNFNCMALAEINIELLMCDWYLTLYAIKSAGMMCGGWVVLATFVYLATEHIV